MVVLSNGAVWKSSKWEKNFGVPFFLPGGKICGWPTPNLSYLNTQSFWLVNSEFISRLILSCWLLNRRTVLGEIGWFEGFWWIPVIWWSGCPPPVFVVSSWPVCKYKLCACCDSPQIGMVAGRILICITGADKCDSCTPSLCIVEMPSVSNTCASSVRNLIFCE